MNKPVYFLLLVILLGYASHVSAIPTIAINDLGQQLIDGNQVEYLVDTSSTLTIYDLSSDSKKYAWLTGKRQVLDFGQTQATYWLRLRLENTTYKKIHQFLELDNPQLDKVNFYSSNAAGQYYQIPGGKTHRNFVYPIDLDVNDGRIYYLQIQSDGSLHLPLVLRETTHWQQHQTTEYIALGIYLTLFMLSGLFIGAHYFRSRDRFYIYGSTYAFSFLFMQTLSSGLIAQYVFPESPVVVNILHSLSIAITCISGLLTTRSFLKKAYFSPSIDKLVKYVVPIPAIILPAVILGYKPLIQFLLHSVVVVSLASALYVTAKSIRWQDWFGRFYLFALLLLAAGFIPSLLSTQDILTYGIISKWGYYFASALHFVCLVISFVLWDEHCRQQNIASQETFIKKMQQIDKLKDEFLANTSHELRTPLNGIIGLSKTLLSGISGQLNNAQYNSQQLINQSAQRLSLLVDDILNYSELQHGTFKLEIREINLNPVIEAVIGVVLPLAAQKNIRIHNTASSTPYWIKADENRLQQILYNLLGNAIKFTEHGSIEISTYNHKGEVYVSIKDTGIGIDESEIDHIFEAFRQVDGTSTRLQNGTGLGLSITRQLLELQHGTIEVDSHKGEGTTVTFSLPEAPEEIVKQLASEQHQTVSPILPSIETTFSPSHEIRKIIERNKQVYSIEDAHKITVFAIDDDPINLEVLKTILTGYGFRLITSTSGKDAEEIIETERPALLLLDIMMPGISGYEICSRLRQHHDEIDLPVIMVTAKTQTQDLTRAYACGANDYITKPFDSEELIARIHAHLQIQNLVNALKENEQLRTEIILRKQAEEDLKQSQHRLMQLLDIGDHAMLCFNQDQELVYFNDATTKLFGYSNAELKDAELDELFADEVVQMLTQYNSNDPQANISTLSCIHKDGHTVSASAAIHQIDMQGNHGFAIALKQNVADITSDHQALNRQALSAIDQHEQRMTAVEQSLMSLLEIAKNNPGLITPINPLHTTTAQAAEHIDHKLHLRKQAVEVMCRALACWEHDLGKSKLALAEESLIWPVYIDKSTPTTRTLDKYLNLDTSPKNPRSQRVIDTAEFVLSRMCKKSTTHSQQLRQSLDAFRQCLAGTEVPESAP